MSEKETSSNGFAMAEESVYQRYAAAANTFEPALCCPVDYAPDFLEVIPDEVIQRDYGCGDPTPYVHPGETVLDLGSGGGKLCFIAAQVVGENGRVIGVDCNSEMLALARKHAPTVASRLGFDNVEFRYGMIQDLKLDLQSLEDQLSAAPVRSSADYLRLRQLESRLRGEQPLVESDSIDCVVSNCVLNLVSHQDRNHLFSEIFRVLKRGGRAAISDIVADESIPSELENDPELWSGCLSGAFREDEFIKAFEDAGFHGIHLEKRISQPWRVVEGIEFRSVTVLAYKGKQGPCLERNQTLLYRGPFKCVHDDDGHMFRRGERTAVCDKTFQLLRQPPYSGMFEPIEPFTEVPIEAARPFECGKSMRLRHPRETKGSDYHVTTESPAGCGDADTPCC